MPTFPDDWSYIRASSIEQFANECFYYAFGCIGIGAALIYRMSHTSKRLNYFVVRV